MKYGKEVIGRCIGIPCVEPNAEEADGNTMNGSSSAASSSNLKYSLRKGVIRRMRVSFEIEFENGFVDCMDLEEEEGRQQLMWIQDKDKDVSVEDEDEKEQEHDYVIIPEATKSDESPSSSSSSSSSSFERERPEEFEVVKTEKVENESSTDRVAPMEEQNAIPRTFCNNGGKESKKRLFPSQANQAREPMNVGRQESENQIDEKRRPISIDEAAAGVEQPTKAASRVDNNMKPLMRPKKRQTTEAHEATLLNARSLALQHGDSKDDTPDQQAASSTNRNRDQLLHERKEKKTERAGSESPTTSHASTKAGGTSPTVDSPSFLHETSCKPTNLSSTTNNGTAKTFPRKRQITSDLDATANKHQPSCSILNAAEGTRMYKKNSEQDESGTAVMSDSLHGMFSKGIASSHRDSIQATAESSDVPPSSGLASNKQSSKPKKPAPKKKQILPSTSRYGLTVAFLQKSVPRKAATQVLPSKPSISSASASLAKPIPRKKQIMSPSNVSGPINPTRSLLEKPVPRKKQILCRQASMNRSIVSPLASFLGQEDAGKRKASKDSNERTALQAEASKETTASHQVANSVRRVSPDRQTQDIAWVEEFHKWLLNTAHGRNNETVSEENANRIIAKVKLLAKGKGISYVRWRKDVVFYKGKKVDLTSDFDRMLTEAKQFEEKHGEDVGHGWVLRHPITKLGLYKQYLQSRGRRLGS